MWGISEKSDGQMKWYEDTKDAALKNRQGFFSKLNLDVKNSVTAGIVHGDSVVIVNKENAGQEIENTDGLITVTPGLVLTITVADCLPIYIFDIKNNVIGLCHAGWRGVGKNIVSKMILKMKSEFRTDPSDVAVMIGPHIKDCHFEIKEDVAEKFLNYKEYIIRDQKIIKLNLAGVVTKQLMDIGLKSENIKISPECTFHLDKKYFSFRRDHPERIEAMMAYMVM